MADRPGSVGLRRLGRTGQAGSPWLLALTVALLALLLLFLALAMLPVGWARGMVERRISAQVGARASVGKIERESRFSLAPVIAIRDVRIAQPDWAGKTELASIRTMRLRLHVLPLLIGRMVADPLSATGVRLRLFRAAGGRENWRVARKDSGGGSHRDLSALAIEDAVVRYDDAKQKRSFTLAVRSDRRGFSAEGSGNVDGAPVEVTARGPALSGSGRWPFSVSLKGQQLSVGLSGSMARPLATNDMRFHMDARADDLKRLDRLIEAGLFRTQPVDLHADVEHSGDQWKVARLTGSVGQSRLTGSLTVSKQMGRSKLDGRVRFSRLNFDDLASDDGLAKAAALERQIGPKLIPNTRINIRKINRTDGRIAVQVDQVVGGKRPSSITTLSARLVLEDRVLTIAPLRIGLRHGEIIGEATVYQRDDRPKPRVTLNLDLVKSSVSALAGSQTGGVEARIDGRVRVTGSGDTLREVVGRSDGMIGVAARAGAVPETIAGLIGFDLGKGLLGSDRKQVALRCAGLRLGLSQGRASVETLVVDTSASQSVGHGAILFPSEALALTLTGAPKQRAFLRLDGPVRIGGYIRDPSVVIPPSFKSAKTILKAIGKSLTNSQPAEAADADCGALLRRTIGGS